MSDKTLIRPDFTAVLMAQNRELADEARKKALHRKSTKGTKENSDSRRLVLNYLRKKMPLLTIDSRTILEMPDHEFEVNFQKASRADFIEGSCLATAIISLFAIIVSLGSQSILGVFISAIALLGSAGSFGVLNKLSK